MLSIRLYYDLNTFLLRSLYVSRMASIRLYYDLFTSLERPLYVSTTISLRLYYDLYTSLERPLYVSTTISLHLYYDLCVLAAPVRADGGQVRHLRRRVRCQSKGPRSTRRPLRQRHLGPAVFGRWRNTFLAFSSWNIWVAFHSVLLSDYSNYPL